MTFMFLCFYWVYITPRIKLIYLFFYRNMTRESNTNKLLFLDHIGPCKHESVTQQITKKISCLRKSLIWGGVLVSIKITTFKFQFLTLLTSRKFKNKKFPLSNKKNNKNIQNRPEKSQKQKKRLSNFLKKDFPKKIEKKKYFFLKIKLVLLNIKTKFLNG